MKNEDKILKWLNNDLSDEELEVLKGTDDYKIFEPIIKAAGRITIPEIDVEASLNDLKTRKHTQPAHHLRNWMKIAAVGLLCLLAGSAVYIFGDSGTTVKSGYAENIRSELPDGSEVLLNARSRIKFEKGHWENKREVFLEGEAYFKVEKGKEFTVKTADGNVKVLGTQFNVRERPGLFEVYCYEGMVAVLVSGKSFVLKPGTSVAMIEGVLQEVKTFKEVRPVWLQNRSSFEGVPLKYVFEELKRQYDVDIELEDKSLLKKKFSGSFVNNDLSKAMEVISYSMDMNYEIKGHKVIIYAE